MSSKYLKKMSHFVSQHALLILCRSFILLCLFTVISFAIIVLKLVFFEENVRYPVWICRDPIFSDFKNPMIIFSDSRTRFEILGTRIESLKRFKKKPA